MKPPSRPAADAPRMLLRTRSAVLPLLGCALAGLLALLMGLAGATIAAGAVLDLAPEAFGGRGDGDRWGEGGRSGAWSALATGMALCVMGAGAVLSFAAAGVPHELGLDGRTGDVVVRRHPLGEVRIPRQRLRHVRVTGRTDRSGRPLLVVRLAARGRRVVVLVDGGRDMDALLARVLDHARGLADVLGVPLVLEGWARDPGHAPGLGRPVDRVTGDD